jgi:glycosyltransferase involved in cell wall biosynthesis
VPICPEVAGGGRIALRILILSFYYPPDLSAGSFRTGALVKALLERLPEIVHIEVITTLPQRYDSFAAHALALEELPRLTIHRIKLQAHGSGMLAQARAFAMYARETMARVDREQYALVYGTSSRLMTAALSAHVARKKRIPLYLDIRDVFVDTINDVLAGGVARLTHPFFSMVERWTITRADSVNLVSPGFEGYFSSRYPEQRYTYFTNGIDDEFITAGEKGVGSTGAGATPVTALYAGNIGEGQGLHNILPELASRLAGQVAFRVIGDGGRRRKLEEELVRVGCTNVHIEPPMKRDRLLEAYREADVLFLHLNDYSAFNKVLPSKLFEYAATGKPVWAGVAGYAASFVRGEIENSAVFPPCDVDNGVRALSELILETIRRTAFVAKYARDSIMMDMSADIVRFLPAPARGGRECVKRTSP